MNTRPAGFTAFHWTTETAFFGYSLRDTNGRARAIITHSTDLKYGFGFHGQVFTAGMPQCGPYPCAEAVADWIVEFLTGQDMVPKDSEFAPLPEVA